MESYTIIIIIVIISFLVVYGLYKYVADSPESKVKERYIAESDNKNELSGVDIVSEILEDVEDTQELSFKREEKSVILDHENRNINNFGRQSEVQINYKRRYR